MTIRSIDFDGQSGHDFARVADEDLVNGQRGRLARVQGPPSALPFGRAHRAIADRMPSHDLIA